MSGKEVRMRGVKVDPRTCRKAAVLVSAFETVCIVRFFSQLCRPSVNTAVFCFSSIVNSLVMLLSGAPPPSSKSSEAEEDAHVSFDLNGAGYGSGQGLRARDRRKALLTAALLPYLLAKLDAGHERYDEAVSPGRIRCNYET